jgi:hypothetical protein
MLEIGQTLNIFQSVEQALFLWAGQAQDAQIGAGCVQQALTPAIAGTGWTGLADLERGRHGFPS